jgi:hypothetical protein
MYFLELGFSEVRAQNPVFFSAYSRTSQNTYSTHLGVPARGCSYRRILCARAAGESGEFLGVGGGAEGFAENNPMAKLCAVGMYPAETEARLGRLKRGKALVIRTGTPLSTDHPTPQGRGDAGSCKRTSWNSVNRKFNFGEFLFHALR